MNTKKLKGNNVVKSVGVRTGFKIILAGSTGNGIDINLLYS